MGNRNPDSFHKKNDSCPDTGSRYPYQMNGMSPDRTFRKKYRQGMVEDLMISRRTPFFEDF
jgi:hypothetical protein